MDRDFFIKLVFATHKAVSLLPNAKDLQKLANQVLSDLLLFCENNPVTIDQKKNILPRTLREIDALVASLNKEKNSGSIEPKVFAVFEKEYKKIPALLIAFLEQHKDASAPEEAPKSEGFEKEIPLRQKKILEFIRNKEKTQVWELQKVLPEVTKRTLRRDLDHLLARGLIERKGEWNNVAYTIR